MDNFFFLRPYFLLAIPIIVVLSIVLRPKVGKSQWWNIMDNNIAHALIIKERSNKIINVKNSLLLLLFLLLFALSGPTYEKRLPEDVKEKASVIVLLANSDSMYSGDIPPNRIRAAKSKIKILQTRLPKSRFGLVAYDYSAHIITPLTDDANFFDMYINVIEPSLMPKRELLTSGLKQGLELTRNMTKDTELPVNVVILTDQMTAQDRADIVSYKSQFNTNVEVLAVGTKEGGALRFSNDGQVSDRTSTNLPVNELSKLKSQGVPIYGITQNDDDITWLVSNIKKSIKAFYIHKDAYDWNDIAPWFALVLLPICLMLFRKGIWVFGMLFVCNLTLYPSTSNAMTWDDIWWTPDQIAQKAFDMGDYEKAAQHYENSYLKGLSYYRLGDYVNAEKYFKKEQSEYALFYLGNSLAYQGKFKSSLVYYGKAIKINDKFEEAKYNVNIIKKRLEEANKLPDNNANKSENKYAIQLQQGARSKEKLKPKAAIDASIYSEDELNTWLGKVKSAPDKMLKTKFELESQRKMIDEL
ncbi:VWA domain-containing protein [Vibrio parahaemolyticus]|uniref:VWA domain-containing protein n=1 Tax=Vibrio parahaemolyticus TaxID=670 RepID=UPI0023621459|nr:VWA domain-containing protein [Vibrio parahaemolyticus]